MSRWFVAAWKWYDGVLVRRPLVSQSISTGVIAAVGDVIAQVAIEKKGWEKFDAMRTVKFGLVGVFYMGPMLRFWYKSLEVLVPVKQGLKAGFLKMSADQLLFAPPFVATLLAAFSLTQGRSAKEVKLKVEKDWWNTLQKNWLIWPGVQMITFSVVPLKLRVVFVQLVAVGWNSYLAWVAHRD